MKRVSLLGVAVALVVAGLSVLLPAAAVADVERCSGPVAASYGATYRTCISASPTTVRARTYMYTLECTSPGGCLYPGSQRLYVEMYRNGVRVAADAIDVYYGQARTWEVAVEYSNAPGTERYRSAGRVTNNPASTPSPDIIV